MATTISKSAFNSILRDINKGVFSDPDTTKIEYYNNDLIEVRADVGNYYNLLDFSVIVADEDGVESYLCEEQTNSLRGALEQSLRDTLDIATAEASHIEYLRNFCA